MEFSEHSCVRYSSQNVVPCCLGGPDNNRREFVVMESWPRKFQYRPLKESSRTSNITKTGKEIQEEKILGENGADHVAEINGIFAATGGVVAMKKNNGKSTKIVTED